MEKNKVDISLLQKYLNGELDARAMYEIERQAQDDPILIDVMLGMENGKKETDKANLHEISIRIKKRVKSGSSMKLFTWKTWSAVASLFLAFSLTGLWFFRTAEKNQMQIQKNAVVQQKVSPEVVNKVKVPGVLSETKPAVPAGDLALNKFSLAKSARKRKRISGKLPTAGDAQVSLNGALTASTMSLKDSSTVNAGTLAEVVVMGYPLAAKKSVAMAVQTIVSDTLHRNLSGKVAGIQIGKDRYISTMVITGVVNDKEYNSPLPGVTVRLKGNKSVETLTDAQGRFSIALPSKKSVIEVIAIGYSRQQVKADSVGHLSIILEPDYSALSEVVVTAPGRNAKSGKAQPEIGWKAYNQYLKEKGKVQTDDINGNVKLTFMINQNGRPVSIKILKGLNDDLNQKAFKIVADGPKWRRNEANPDEEIRLAVKFHH